MRLLLLFFAALFVADAMVGERGLVAVFRARHEYQNLTIEIERLKTLNADLREQARRLREDAAAIEAVARQELGLIRPGEKVFIIRKTIDDRPD